jgi:hypothetical protein
MPPRFAPNANYHVQDSESTSIQELLARQAAAAAAIAAAAEANLAAQRTLGDQLQAAIDAGDQAAAVAARNSMWEAVYALHKRLYEFDVLWNELAPRAAPQTE